MAEAMLAFALERRRLKEDLRLVLQRGLSGSARRRSRARRGAGGGNLLWQEPERPFVK